MRKYTYHQNTFSDAFSGKPRSMNCSVQRPKELKKVRDVETSLLPPFYTSHFVWGRVLDVINHAKFQLHGFRSFGAPGRALRRSRRAAAADFLVGAPTTQYIEVSVFSWTVL